MKRKNRGFSFPLYREGLLHIKLIGVAAAVVCIALCVLTVIVRFSTTRNMFSTEAARTVTTVLPNEVAAPAVLLLFFAPFFVMSQFRFLFNRAKSDFYHSIPFTRTCTFCSFFAASVTWIVGIAVLSYAVPMIMWTLHPDFSVMFGPTLLYLLRLILGCILLAAVMAVSVSITGTPASCLALFGLLCCFVRVICALFLATMNDLVPIVDFGTFLSSSSSFFSPLFFLPIALLSDLVSSDSAITTASVLYNLAITVALIVTSAVLYRLRRSETAGSSAPSRTWQHVYRCAFCAPLAVAVAVQCLISSGSSIIVMLVVTLLAYFLYEIITTKKLKNLVSAIPFLGVLLAVGLIFTGGVYTAREVVLSDVPSADEIQAISLPDFISGNRYEQFRVKEAITDDPKAVSAVSDRLRQSVDALRNGKYRPPYLLADTLLLEEKERYLFCKVMICKNNGSHMVRELWFAESEYQAIQNSLIGDPSFRDSVLAMPEDSEISEISVLPNSTQVFDRHAANAVWKQYLSEYRELSDDEKLNLKGFGKDNQPSGAIYTVITVRGYRNGKLFYSAYPITDRFPKTMAQINNSAQVNGKTPLDSMRELLNEVVNTDCDTPLTHGNDYYASYELALETADKNSYTVYTAEVFFDDANSKQQFELLSQRARLLLENWDSLTDLTDSKDELTAVSFNLWTRQNGGEGYTVFLNLPKSLQSVFFKGEKNYTDKDDIIAGMEGA